MQRLTAVFGMGTGRATAVMPPNWTARLERAKFYKKNHSETVRRFSENYTQESIGISTTRELKLHFLEGKSNQAARPSSAGQLNASRRLHSQPIKRVVCPWSLGTCVRETISWDELGT